MKFLLLLLLIGCNKYSSEFNCDGVVYEATTRGAEPLEVKMGIESVTGKKCTLLKWGKIK